MVTNLHHICRLWFYQWISVPRTCQTPDCCHGFKWCKQVHLSLCSAAGLADFSPPQNIEFYCSVHTYGNNSIRMHKIYICTALKAILMWLWSISLSSVPPPKSWSRASSRPCPHSEFTITVLTVSYRCFPLMLSFSLPSSLLPSHSQLHVYVY